MYKYLEILKYSLKMKTKFIVDYIFSLFSFTIHVFVFNELWNYILQDKLIAGYSKKELIWYIIIAECMIYSMSNIYKRISEMVKNGEIANMLLKPIDFVMYLFADELSIIIKVIVNIILAVILGIVMGGIISINASTVLLLFVSIILSVIIGIFIDILIGLLAFFTEENSSIWLIVQKCMFFLVFTPIEFYPVIVQKLLYLLPTTYMIYSPAKILVNFDLNNSLILIGMQILFASILFVIIRLFYRRGVRNINVNGG